MELFEPARIGSLSLSNHFIRAATWEGQASAEGNPTEGMIELYRELAKGGLGLIQTGVTYIDQHSATFPRQLGLYADAQIPSFAPLSEAVHREGGRIFVQLVHSGSLQFVDNGTQPMGPSAVEQPATGKTPREMTGDDIKAVVAAFACAADRARRAGFDGVTLCYGHGYLVSEFLSPRFNQRTDGYGGSLQSRGRIAFEIVEAVKARVGQDFPVMIKINCADFDGGMDAESSRYYCVELSKRGADAIELSGGTLAGGDLGPARPAISSPEKEAYFLDHAAKLKPLLGCPLVLVGGLRSLDRIEEIRARGAADFFSLCRPLISEPWLIKRWAAGDRTKARCRSCSRCVGAAMEESRLYCKSYANQGTGAN